MKLRCAPLVGLTALCALLSCQPGRRPLLVALSGVPTEATALRITTTLDGRAAADDPQELPASATTVTLGLPLDQSGVLRISAAALDPARCVRAAAATQLRLPLPGDNPSAVPLVLQPQRCGQPPQSALRLTRALPQSVLRSGGTVQLLGAGFGDDTVVRVGSTPCKVTRLSDDRLQVEIPPRGAGPETFTLSAARGDASAALAEPLRYVQSAPQLGAAERLRVTGARALASGDFNGDGLIDLAVARSSTSKVSIYLGREGGTLAAPREVLLDGGAQPAALAAADLNGDGFSDLLVGSSTALFLLRGADSGDLALAGQLGEGVLKTSDALLARDLDLDGRIDVVVADASGAQTYLLRGQEGGTLSAPAVLQSPRPLRPYALAAADLDRDGRPELIVGGIENPDLAVYSFTGAAPGAALVNSGLSRVRALAAADLDGDGYGDVVAADLAGGNLALSYGGPGGLARPRLLVIGTPAVSVLATDISGDGRPDLVYAGPTGDTVGVLLNREGGFAALRAPYAVDSAPVELLAVDLSRDGRPELVVASQGSGTVQLLAGLGEGGFAQGLLAPTLAAPDYQTPSGLVVQDLNGDGWAEVVVTVPSVGLLLPYRGTGSNSDVGLVALPPISGTSAARSVASLDVNGDGRFDLVTTHTGANGIFVLENQGALSFKAPAYVPLLGGEATFDLLATTIGGQPGLFVSAGRQAVAMTGNPLQPATRLLLPGISLGLALGDLDGDRQPDLALGSAESALYFSLGGAAPRTLTVTPPAGVPQSAPTYVLIADLNGDGRGELISANRDAGSLSIFSGFSAAGAPQSRALPVSAGPNHLAAADLDGDGRLDLLVTLGVQGGKLNGDELLLLRGLGDGTFDEPRRFLTSAGQAFVAVADLNGDGRPDVLVLSAESAGAPRGGLTLLRNRTPR